MLRLSEGVPFPKESKVVNCFGYPDLVVVQGRVSVPNQNSDVRMMSHLAIKAGRGRGGGRENGHRIGLSPRVWDPKTSEGAFDPAP